MRVNIGRLLKYCKATKESLHRFFGGSESELYGDFLTFVDNKSNVLGVAHTDTVGELRGYGGMAIASVVDNGKAIRSINLDDRLGVYMLTDLLPSMGVKLDYLLTDNEEIGMSTARRFATEKKYNWMVEFDRHGLNVVMYQYKDEKWRQPLADVGMQLQIGSFSDIAVLDNLGVTGFNWGVGYNMEHTTVCKARIADIEYSASTFIRFYNKWHSTYMPYTPTFTRSKWGTDYCDEIYDIENESWWDNNSWLAKIAGIYRRRFGGKDEDDDSWEDNECADNLYEEEVEWRKGYERISD